MGLLLTVLVTAASVQDRDVAKPLLWNLKKACPKVRLAWADRGYSGKLVTWARTALKLTVEIVRRPDDLHTFKVLPRRWVVERTLARITRHRRTVRDYERLPAHHQTYLYRAVIIVMTRRLARKPGRAGTIAESQATYVSGPTRKFVGETHRLQDGPAVPSFPGPLTAGAIDLVCQARRGETLQASGRAEGGRPGVSSAAGGGFADSQSGGEAG